MEPSSRRGFAQAVTRLRNGLPRLAIAYAALGADTAVATLKEWEKFLALLEEDRPHRRPPVTLARLRELQRGFGFATLAEFIAAVEDTPVPVEAPGAALSPAPLDRQLRGALIRYDDHLAAITQQLATLATASADIARAIERVSTTLIDLSRPARNDADGLLRSHTGAAARARRTG